MDELKYDMPTDERIMLFKRGEMELHVKNVKKLDLNKLGFYSSPMILAGSIDGDFRSLDPDNLNGYLNLQNFAISDTKEVFPVQEIKLNAVSTADSTKINFNSQIADLELKGKYKSSRNSR